MKRKDAPCGPCGGLVFVVMDHGLKFNDCHLPSFMLCSPAPVKIAVRERKHRGIHSVGLFPGGSLYEQGAGKNHIACSPTIAVEEWLYAHARPVEAEHCGQLLAHEKLRSRGKRTAESRWLA